MMATKRLKSDKPVRRDCIAMSAIMFLVGIIAIPAIMFMLAVRHMSEADVAFKEKLPSHRAVEEVQIMQKQQEVSVVVL